MKNKYYPEEIKRYLDKYVVGQEHAKKVLSVAIYNHYLRTIESLSRTTISRLGKPNVLILGGTGCGKTYMVQLLSQYLDIPCYIQDCTKLTASGYVGSDAEDCLVGLLRKCNYNIEKAQKGIVVLDECDKISVKGTGPNIVRDVSGECVQQSLLKIIEGDIIGVPPQGGRKHPEQPLLFVDTSNILFVACGAFSGIESHIKARFANDNDRSCSGNFLEYLSSADLISYGMIPEFVGRFPIVVSVDNLSEADLERILVDSESPLILHYKELLAHCGVELSFNENAIKAIAKYAMELRIGARGLSAVMESIFLDIMFIAPSGKLGTSVQIDENYVIERFKRV